MMASLAPSGETLASRTKKPKKMRIGNEEATVGRTIVMRDEPRELVHEPGDLASAAAHASVGMAENQTTVSASPALQAIAAKALVFVRPGTLRNRCDTYRSIAGFVRRCVAPCRDHRVVQPQ